MSDAAEEQSKEHKHDWHWMPKGPANMNFIINISQAWYRCGRPGCTQVSLRPRIKRLSRFRRKK